ncbi:hypothetical protein NHH03_20230 [Stieleria sp. TO1_6]|uniref:hypothetical protein n=1 Tax=Stieleria tagensis TaxID=2956795 RepID=UPI00209B671D|nr:hypothetical protein [Stieleria tagensis]MCO8124083.1 hypothetical protein [Stieleria tagensis]
MNTKQRKRDARRRHRRSMLLASVLCCVASPAMAETHTNPFFLSKHRISQPAGDTPAATSLPSSDTVPTPRRIRRLPVVNHAPSDPNRPVATERLPQLPPSHRAPQATQAEPAPSTQLGQNFELPTTPPASEQAAPRMIAVAAKRHADLNADQPRRVPAGAPSWLQSITPDSCSDRAAALLDDAYREYSVNAWASAEASGWKAMELIATGIDVTAPTATTTTTAAHSSSADLQQARTAIRESRDFVAYGASVNPSELEGIVSSHQTPVLAGQLVPGLTPTVAADRYLDYARTKLAPLAANRVEAAQAMDLLAAIQLGRNEASWLPEETALCLRRSALQGQPTNPALATRLGMQLASMGLDSEAEMALRHAMSLAPSDEASQALAQIMMRRGDRQAAMQLAQQSSAANGPTVTTNRVPEIVELSPGEFASISPAVNLSGATAAAPGGSLSAQPTQASFAGYRMPTPDPPGPAATPVTQTAPPTAPAKLPRSVVDHAPSDLNPAASDPSADAQREPVSTSKMKTHLNRYFGNLPKLW